jgi:hypothetical protein
MRARAVYAGHEQAVEQLDAWLSGSVMNSDARLAFAASSTSA